MTLPFWCEASTKDGFILEGCLHFIFSTSLQLDVLFKSKGNIL